MAILIPKKRILPEEAEAYLIADILIPDLKMRSS
jgi:hypothetical protein